MTDKLSICQSIAGNMENKLDRSPNITDAFGLPYTLHLYGHWRQRRIFAPLQIIKTTEGCLYIDTGSFSRLGHLQIDILVVLKHNFYSWWANTDFGPLSTPTHTNTTHIFFGTIIGNNHYHLSHH